MLVGIFVRDTDSPFRLEDKMQEVLQMVHRRKGVPLSGSDPLEMDVCPESCQ